MSGSREDSFGDDAAVWTCACESGSDFVIGDLHRLASLMNSSGEDFMVGTVLCAKCCIQDHTAVFGYTERKNV